MSLVIRRLNTRAQRYHPLSPFFNYGWFGRSFHSRVSCEPEPQPPIDVEETDDAVVVRASVPGYRPEEISVTHTEGDLIIEGKLNDTLNEANCYVIRERSPGQFYRRISLQVQTTTKDASAHHEHGVLTIRVPKSEEARTSTITVEQA